MKNNDVNIISVLWSGGLDSTYLIQHLLDENSKNIVWASYVELKNNKEKTEMELNAIKKMLPYLNEKYKERFKYLGVVCSFDIIKIGNCSGFAQLPLWISAIISTTSKDVNKIAIGYVMNDDAIAYLPEFKKIVKSYNAISYNPYPQIIFPIHKYKKHDIIPKLTSELLQHVVWCEYPNVVAGEYSACGQCETCRRSPLIDNKSIKYIPSLGKSKIGKERIYENSI